MLKLEGEVDAYDGWLPWDVSVGGEKLIEALNHEGLDGQDVVVALQHRTIAEGTLRTFTGFGGTDVTPAEPPEVHVGGSEIFGRLAALDGEHVVLCVERRAT